MHRDKPSRYLQIALDFARKIVDDQHKVGDRIFARSALAAQYNVSSETARRAMCVLEDNGIVTAEKGSGIEIVSHENAVAFLNQYQSVRSLEDIRQEILHDLTAFDLLSQKIKQKLETMVDKTDRFKDMGPFTPYQIIIPDRPNIKNKTLEQIQFWQHTKATVIAVKKEEELVFSPGPQARLEPGDTLYFVGDRDCFDRVDMFIHAF